MARRYGERNTYKTGAVKGKRTLSDITAGELALNARDGRLFSTQLTHMN